MAQVWDATSGQWVERPDEAPLIVPPPRPGSAVGAVAGSTPGAAPAPQLPQQQRGGGMYTPQERALMFEHMPDITAGEEELARMQAMSNELRGNAAPQRGRMDWASQASRALSGVGSGLAAKKMPGIREGISGKLKTLGQKMGALGGAGGGSSDGDYWKDNWGI